MPIQTQGHQVQIMPQYTAMDPNRVTFNPAGFTQGALSSIEIIDQLQKQRAFQQAQMELAATRDGRLGAMNAQNLATIQLAPQRSIADIALAQQQAALIPGQTEATLANQEFDRYLRPMTQRVQGQKAETAEYLAATRADQEIKQAELDAQRQAREEQQAPLKGALDLAKLTQDFQNIDSDKSMSDTQKLATIRSTLASAAANEAQARKDDRVEPKKVDPIKELDDIQMQIQRLQATPVVNPNADNTGMPMPMLQYQAQTRDPNGALLKVDNPYWFTGDSPVKLNPEAERVAEQLRILQDRRAAITQSMAAPASSSGAPAPAPAAQKSSSGAKQITSKAEFDALKPGDPFIFNGKAGVKTK
jgi:hypothetical protein